jgi:hypothetical protein
VTRRPRALLAVAGLAAALALSGCAEDGLAAAGTLAPVAAATTGPAVAGTVVDSHLAACPASDVSVATVAGGLPDITLPCLAPGSGPAQVRLAGLRGHAYAISVWQVACAICRQELSTIATVAREAAGQVDFLGVDVEETQRSAVPALFGTAGAVFSSVSDADGATRVPLRWATGLPVMLLVRADGTVAHTIIGGVGSAPAFRAQLRQSLGVTLP